MIAKFALAIVMMTAGMLALKYFTHRNENKKARIKTTRRKQRAGKNRVENLVWDEQTQSYRVKD